MKILHSSIDFLLTIVLLFSIIPLMSQSAIGKVEVYNPTLEDQLGNLTQTKLIHNNSILILNQTTPKLVYKSGENITINTELINIGNTTTTIGYCEPLVALEIKNQTGDEIWPNSQVACIPELTGKKTLQPGEHISIQPWEAQVFPDTFPPPRLYVPGNYTAKSVALFTFNINSKSLGPIEPLWSEPLQITILPEKIPEFPSVTITILTVGLVSLIVFSRIKNKT